MKANEVRTAAREGRTARRLFSAALMSDTKWRKLIGIVRDAHPGLREVTVKFIGTEGTRRLDSPPWLYPPRPYADSATTGPFALRAIEWMEFPLDLTELLRPAGHFPIEVAEGRTRVIGYAAPIGGPGRG